MTLGEGALPFPSSDSPPVREWLEDLRGRLDGWTQGFREGSLEEWTRLQTAVRRAFSTERVGEALEELLARVGLAGSPDVKADELLHDLRVRILRHQETRTIESYTRYLSPPPSIRL